MADYGADLNMIQRPDGILDFPEDGGVISGEDLIKQSIVIRLSTERGTVLDAPDDGLSLIDYLSRGMDTNEAASLAGVIEAELRKDERIVGLRVGVDISTIHSTNSFDVALSIDVGAGPFPLVLTVSEAGVVVGGA